MAIELATAYVSLTASAKGLRDDIKREVDGAADDAADAGEQAGDGFSTGMGGKLALFGATAGLALGAALVKGTFDALDAEAQNDRLAASLGLDPAEAARLGEVAGDLYAAAYGESLGEVNDVLRSVYAELGGEEIPTDNLEFYAQSALGIAETFDQDFNEVIRAASALLSNDLVTDAGAAFDVITAGFQAAGPRGDDLIDTLSQYSNQFSDLGLDAEEALSLMASALDGGAVSTDAAADAIKESFLRITEGPESVRDAVAELGLDFDELQSLINQGDGAAALQQLGQSFAVVEDQSDAARLAAELFAGTYEMVGLDGVIAMGDLTTSISDVEGAAGDLSSTLNNNLSTRLESLKRTGLQALADIAVNTVVPALEAVVGFVGPIVEAFGENGWSGAVDALMEQLTPLTDWIADNQVLFAVIAGVVGGILVAAFVALAVAAGSAAIAVLAAAAPFIAVGVAVGAVAGALVWAYNNSEKFREVVDRLGAFIRDEVVPALQDFAGWIMDYVVPALAAIAGWVADWVLPALADFIDRTVVIGETVVTVATTIFDWFGDVVSFVKDLPGQISDAAAGMWDGISAPFKTMVDYIRDLWNDTLGGFSFSIPDWVPEIGGNGLTIPVLHQGGIVPGRPGSEQLALLQAGELVIPADMVGDAAPPTGSGSSGVSIGTVNVVNRPWLEELTEAMYLRPVA